MRLLFQSTTPVQALTSQACAPTRASSMAAKRATEAVGVGDGEFCQAALILPRPPPHLKSVSPQFSPHTPTSAGLKVASVASLSVSPLLPAWSVQAHGPSEAGFRPAAASAHLWNLSSGCPIFHDVPWAVEWGLKQADTPFRAEHSVVTQHSGQLRVSAARGCGRFHSAQCYSGWWAKVLFCN